MLGIYTSVFLYNKHCTVHTIMYKYVTLKYVRVKTYAKYCFARKKMCCFLPWAISTKYSNYAYNKEKVPPIYNIIIVGIKTTGKQQLDINSQCIL